MKLHIPNSAFLGNIEPFLRAYSPENPDVLEVSFNQEWTSVHPFVISMAAALGETMNRQEKPITYEKSNAKSINYLSRMGLFDYLRIPVGRVQEHDPSGRFIPLRKIQDSQGLSAFIEDLVPLLHSNPQQANAIKFTVSELVRNVLEHAESPIGAMVCAQFFRKTNKVAIGVADAGVGIRETISTAHHAEDDHDALRLALTPGITGATSKPGGTAQNAGAGLFFVKSIAKINRNLFAIFSGKSFYKLLKTPVTSKVTLDANPDQDRHSFDDALPPWKGTVVGVDISIDETQDFSSLLNNIRAIYRLDAKEKQKQHYKKARFI